MSDQNWNASDIGGGIAAIIGALGGDDNTVTPAPSVHAADFDISSALPYVLLAVGGIVALKVLKVI